MALPPGLTPSGSKGKVCRLRRPLYDLKQSARAWFGRFHKAMHRFGYRQSNVDHTLFIRINKGKLTVLIVYVDDIIITEDDKEEIQALKEKKYVLDLLEATGMSGCRPADTPIEANHKLGREDDDVIDDIPSYQRLVGKLIYLSHTRPDISYAVGVLSRFMHSPKARHIDAAHCVLRYLKSSPGKGILFSPNKELTIEVYTDADWAGSPTDKRYTTGYCSMVGGNVVSWRSKKQHVVARSSAEAEFRAVSHGICEGLWVSTILKELGLKGSEPIRLYCDNKAAISIAHNPVQHDRTKHIEIDRHFIKENIDRGTVVIPFIPSDQQLADVLTKGLSSSMFADIIGKFGMADITRPT
ncbi:hypothetical protein KSP39_PZI008749 [Platanthera zijinensis]|uniref:Reverse transcriptase Ty1/copia-type domain-containing protein n=1 Tax=Platanthera zijinensis TaxID=2320716 RepID=A0AAP0BKK8_9ASPA